MGPPEGLAESLGHLSADESEPAAILLSRILGRWVQYSRHAWDRPTPSAAVTTSALSPSPHHGTNRLPRTRSVEKCEGNTEGDCLELARLLKETIPSK